MQSMYLMCTYICNVHLMQYVCVTFTFLFNLQVEVAETSEAVAQSAHALTQLAVVLPSQEGLFGKAACQAAQQERTVRMAGQQGTAWQDASPPLQQVQKMDASCCVLYHLQPSKRIYTFILVLYQMNGFSSVYGPTLLIAVKVCLHAWSKP